MSIPELKRFHRNPDPVWRLTFEHRDFNGSTIGANAVAADAHVRARVGHLDVGDEQSADVGAGLEEDTSGDPPQTRVFFHV